MSKKKFLAASIQTIVIVTLLLGLTPNALIHALPASCDHTSSDPADPCYAGGSAKNTISIQNPIPSATDVPSLVRNITSGILGIVGAVALLMFIYGGVLLLTSMGNTQKVDKGKNTLLWAAMGLVVIFLSYSILTFIFDAISKNK